MDKYLKEESYYGNLYNLGTIENCIEVVEFWKNIVDEEHFKGLKDGTIKAQTRNAIYP